MPGSDGARPLQDPALRTTAPETCVRQRAGPTRIGWSAGWLYRSKHTHMPTPTEGGRAAGVQVSGETGQCAACVLVRAAGVLVSWYVDH